VGVNKLVGGKKNTTGQMVQVLKSFGIKTDKIILKYDGRPFTVQELEKKVK
jgi:2-oxoglutarate/2-oxoacid ferredoxin oxidoreductase subunit alpha